MRFIFYRITIKLFKLASSNQLVDSSLLTLYKNIEIESLRQKLSIELPITYLNFIDTIDNIFFHKISYINRTLILK